MAFERHESGVSRSFQATPPRTGEVAGLSVGGGTVRDMAKLRGEAGARAELGSAAPDRGQDGWDEHAAFMDGLVDDGFIILGGPVGDGEQTLHAVEAADEGEIRTRLALDPWASAGLLRMGPIEPWALWLDGRGLDGRGLDGRGEGAGAKHAGPVREGPGTPGA